MHAIREHVPLAPLTTIGLGGKARYLITCATTEELVTALRFAHERQLPVAVLGGGSNVVIADEGFAGLVIQPLLRGLVFETDGTMVAHAGEVWDAVVAAAVERELAGIECLSGIPGLVGATPVQNVGAYGQSVSQMIVSVTVLDRETLAISDVTHADCDFAYRRSRFKDRDHDRYIITAVTFRLRPGGAPTLVYPELAARVGDTPTLTETRSAVIALRRRKSMVVDAHDPHSRSCGSFFTHPVLGGDEFARVREYCEQAGMGEVPAFPEGEGTKIPAGWLIEQAGFTRGERHGGVGISPNHALALVNYGGTTAELLALADTIEAKVQRIFGITLKREPVSIP